MAIHRRTFLVAGNEQDFAVGTDCVRDFHIQCNLQRPTGILARISRSAILVHFAEATIRSRAGRQAKLAVVDGKIGFDVGVIVGVHNADGG